jgi:hypothetical protein
MSGEQQFGGQQRTVRGPQNQDFVGTHGKNSSCEMNLPAGADFDISQPGRRRQPQW